MKKKKILWADDDPDDLMLMRQVLQESEQDFDIIEVPNGREALNYLDKASDKSLPCLIILDMNMPVLNGRETLAIIKSEKEYKNIPTVVFTTSSSELDKMFCKRYNVEMITKPPSFKNLNAAVHRLLSFCQG
jgi:CheY-like chemotaxis protein